jgi:hypothetical protein
MTDKIDLLPTVVFSFKDELGKLRCQFKTNDEMRLFMRGWSTARTYLVERGYTVSEEKLSEATLASQSVTVHGGAEHNECLLKDTENPAFQVLNRLHDFAQTCTAYGYNPEIEHQVRDEIDNFKKYLAALTAPQGTQTNGAWLNKVLEDSSLEVEKAPTWMKSAQYGDAQEANTEPFDGLTPEQIRFVKSAIDKFRSVNEEQGTDTPTGEIK